jgi:protein PhnA
MTIEQLHERSGSVCELCSGTQNLQSYDVLPAPLSHDAQILICEVCAKEINEEKLNGNHWRSLNSSMWSEVRAVQVMAWRLLQKLLKQGEAWAQDLLDMLYLDEEMLAWANAGETSLEVNADEQIIHKDSNGTVLQPGDTVVLIKDLDVKGGGFTAKRGTAVRGIALVDNNASQIEGRVNGQQIVILTQYVKKSG